MLETKRYYFFIGTVAELIKIFPIILEMEKREIDYYIISSGQNEIEKSDVFKVISKYKSIIRLSNGVKKKSAISLFSWFLKTLVKSIFGIRKKIKSVSKNDYMLVHGDTVSTVMGAIIGRVYGFSVCHVESGLRSFNMTQPFPEELDRIITSKLTDIHFPPNDWALSNLKKIRGKKYNTINNTLLDSLNYALNQNIKTKLIKDLKNNKFSIFVCHRQENLVNEKLLINFIESLLKTSKKYEVLFILHEITKIALEKFDLLDSIKDNKNIILVDRLPYFELMHILSKAEFMVTDGGSNQEECYYLGIPTFILRNYSERIEGIDKNVVLMKNNYKKIDKFIDNYKKYKTNSILNESYISPSKIIVDNLL